MEGCTFHFGSINRTEALLRPLVLQIIGDSRVVDGALDLVPGKLSAGNFVMLGLIPNTATQAPLHHVFKQSTKAVADAPTIDAEAAVAADEKVEEHVEERADVAAELKAEVKASPAFQSIEQTSTLGPTLAEISKHVATPPPVQPTP